MIYDLTKLKRHRYSISFDGRDLGPLIGEPEIVIRCKRLENRSFDPSASGDAGTGHATVTDALATVTVATGNIGGALELLADFSVGDDILAAARRHALVFIPPQGIGEKFLTFGNAWLLPELEYAPKAENHAATLHFQARPDASGTLFTFAIQEY